MISFPVPAEVACAYLADPVNRPEWQSSLRGVEVLDPGPPHVGQRWVDVTWPGLRPVLETTVLEPGVRWQEFGRWRGVTAHVTLGFTPVDGGCLVDLSARVTGRGPLAALGPALTRAGLVAGHRDLRRAARLVAGRR